MGTSITFLTNDDDEVMWVPFFCMDFDCILKSRYLGTT